MEKIEYPKLHLPPWFHEGWAELIEQKQWFAGSYVELANGTFVRPTFITLERIKNEMASNAAQYYFEIDLVIIDIVNIDRILQLLPSLAGAGVLMQMRSYRSIEWE